MYQLSFFSVKILKLKERRPALFYKETPQCIKLFPRWFSKSSLKFWIVLTIDYKFTLWNINNERFLTVFLKSKRGKFNATEDACKIVWKVFWG